MVNLYKIRKQLVIIDLKWIMIFFFSKVMKVYERGLATERNAQTFFIQSNPPPGKHLPGGWLIEQNLEERLHFKGW